MCNYFSFLKYNIKNIINNIFKCYFNNIIFLTSTYSSAINL